MFMASWLCIFPHYFSMAPHPEFVVPLPHFFSLPALAPSWGALLACPGHIWSHKKAEYILCLPSLMQTVHRRRQEVWFLFFFLLLTFAYYSVQSRALSCFGAPSELTYVCWLRRQWTLFEKTCNIPQKDTRNVGHLGGNCCEEEREVARGRERINKLRSLI